MFKNEWAGTWLLIGLVGSVLLRGALWVLTVLNVAPLLGPVDLLLFSAVGHTVGTAIWLGDIVASFLFAVATGVACQGLRGDRAWAYRLGQGLARFYVVLNAATAMVCGVVMLDWGPQSWSLLAFPFLLYIVSIVIAIAAAHQLAARRSLLQDPGQPEPAGQE